MAIKEFEISPQNYFEDGFFDGDYTERQNQSFGSLSCEAERLVGFNFEAGFYYEQGFMEDGAFGVNSIIFTLEVDAMIVQVAEISMQGYMQEGYYAQGYHGTNGSTFTLTAELESVGEVVEAIGSWTSQFAQAATVSKTIQLSSNVSAESTQDSIGNLIAGASSTISAEFSQTAMISHIEGADLFAFSEAQLAIEVSRIRDNNIEASSAFNVATDAVRTVFIAAQADSFVEFAVANQRVRNEEAAVDAAFSLTASIEAFTYIEATADLTCTTQATGTAVRIRRTSGNLQAQFTQTTQEKVFDTFDEIISSTTEALVHFNELPLLDVKQAGTPQIFARNSSGDLISYTATLTTGKFGQMINWPGSSTQLTVQETANIDLSQEDFIYETWYDFQGDISSYPQGDGVIMTLGGGAGQTITYTSHTGSTVTSTFNTAIYIYNSDFHNSITNTAYRWGMSDLQLYVNWNPNTITSPPEAQKISYQVSQLTGWTHFLISRQGTTWRLFINGTLTNSWTGTRRTGSFPTTTMTIGSGAYYGYYDEWRLRKGQTVTANFSAPTQEYPPPQIALTRSSYGIWNSTATLSADFLRVNLASSAMQASTALAAQSIRIRPANSLMATQSTMTVAATTLIQAQASINVETDSTATALRIRGNLVQTSSTASLQANTSIQAQALAEIQAQVQAVIDNNRLRDNSATTQCQVTATINSVKITDIELDLTAFTAQLIEGVIVGRAEIVVENFATLAVDARKITDQPIALSTTSIMSVQGTNIVFATAEFSSEFQQTSTEEYLRRIEIIAESTTELSASVSKFTGYSADLLATTELSALNDRLRDFDLALESTAEQTTVNDILRLALADLVAATEQITEAGTFTRFEADLASQGFVLAIGSALRIDPYNQIKINSELRTYIVDPETRLLTVNSETRVNIIQGNPT